MAEVNKLHLSGFILFRCMQVLSLVQKKGMIVSFTLGIAALGYFIFDDFFPGFAQYIPDFKIRFLVSYFIVVIFSHIAERFRDNAQKKLKKAHDTLEQRVQERTAELTAKKYCT